MYQGLVYLEQHHTPRGGTDPDLRRLPYRLRKTIKDHGPLNMASANAAVADQVVRRVIGVASRLSPDNLGTLPAHVGVGQVPGLAYMTATPGRRKLLAAAFKEALSTEEAKKSFLQASFVLQGDAVDNADVTNPLFSLFNAGGLHSAIYHGSPYDDGPVAGWFSFSDPPSDQPGPGAPAPSARGGRGGKVGKGRTRRRGERGRQGRHSQRTRRTRRG